MNVPEDIPKLAKAVIREEVELAGCTVKRILLFGSRARGEAVDDSDWDFFVIVDKDIPYATRWEISDRIRQRFVDADFCGDVFVQSEKMVNEREGNTGFLAYYALKEGMDL